MFRPTLALVDLNNLEHNLKTLKTWAGYGNGGSFFCPMVKANAYGHGDLLVAQVAEKIGVSALGVALIEEGIELRRLGIRAPILTFAPLERGSGEALAQSCLTPVIGRMEDLSELARVSIEFPVQLHLKFNTGMQRLGFDEADMPKLKSFLQLHPNLRIQGVCTHLTHGEDADRDDGPSARQLQRFAELTRDFPGIRHAHKSSSLAVLRKANKLDGLQPVGVRPGISIYGLPHHAHDVGENLRPVLTWRSEIFRVHQVSAGHSVSYGDRWQAKRASQIGVVPMGYGDGYPRSLSNKGQMLFRGRRVPVIGSVCMDYILLDLTDAIQDGLPQAGEEVIVIGQQGREYLSAAEVADWSNTIAYETVTSISKRVQRVARTT